MTTVILRAVQVAGHLQRRGADVDHHRLAVLDQRGGRRAEAVLDVEALDLDLREARLACRRRTAPPWTRSSLPSRASALRSRRTVISDTPKLSARSETCAGPAADGAQDLLAALSGKKRHRDGTLVNRSDRLLSASNDAWRNRLERELQLRARLRPDRPSRSPARRGSSSRSGTRRSSPSGSVTVDLRRVAARRGALELGRSRAWTRAWPRAGRDRTASARSAAPSWAPCSAGRAGRRRAAARGRRARRPAACRPAATSR